MCVWKSTFSDVDASVAGFVPEFAVVDAEEFAVGIVEAESEALAVVIALVLAFV